MYNSIINVNDLNDLLNRNSAVVIDCRHLLTDPDAGYQAYLQSHIPGAFYAHLDNDLSGEIIPGKTGRHPFPDIEEFVKKCGHWGIDNQTQVIAYDHGHGGIAARLWFLLKWLGHEKVAVLNGGWNQWEKMGLPVSNNISEPANANFQPNEQKGWLVSAEVVGEMATDPNYMVFDSRTADRYRGENETIDPVAGHIPGAVSAPFIDNLRADGLFLDKENLTERFDKLLAGLSPGNAVFYCGSGVTACHNLLALSYIGKDGVKLYPGSWSDWITDETRPVAIGE